MYFGGSDRHADSLEGSAVQEPQSWRWLWVFSLLWVGLESRREDSCVYFVKNIFAFSTFRGCFYWVYNCRFWSSLPKCCEGLPHSVPMEEPAKSHCSLEASMSLSPAPRRGFLFAFQLCWAQRWSSSNLSCLGVVGAAVFFLVELYQGLILNEICRILGHCLFVDSISWTLIACN